MITDLLNPDVQDFIKKYANADVNDILLKHKSIFGIPASVIANQIKSKQKAEDKIPTYFNNSKIIFPPTINLEQSSSELTAQFKLSVIKGVCKKNLKAALDLTGGFGIDACFLSEGFNQYYFVEPNKDLLDIAEHNHNALAKNNIKYHNVTAEEFLKQSEDHYDLIYVDPSRRDANNKKIFSLSDCEPNILTLQDQVYSRSEILMLKASPLFDLQQGIKELKFVKKVLVVALENDCKEVLFMTEKNFTGEPVIEAVNIIDGSAFDSFIFTFSEEKKVEIEFSEPKNYLYEPNAAIMKAGAFKLISQRFGLTKLHLSTHLYTSTQLIENFPGRIFRAVSLVKPDIKSIKQFIPEGKANVTTRNYPLSVEELKKKTGLKDGGEKYLIGFTDIKKKNLVVADRLK